jgi:hypothetical protein
MRSTLYTSVAILLATSPIQVQAAEISEAGARDIQAALTRYLPQKIKDAGVLTVRAGTRRYELTFDAAPLVDMLGENIVTINGLKPFVHYLTPRDDGQWKVELTDRLDINGTIKTQGQASDFSYIIDKMIFDGLYDPSITYFSSGHMTMESLMFSTRTGPASVEGTMASATQDVRANKTANGLVDIGSDFSFQKMTELVNDPSTGQAKFSIDNGDGSLEMVGFGMEPFRDLVLFGLDLAQSNPQNLSAADNDRLKQLIRANIPFVDQIGRASCRERVS